MPTEEYPYPKLATGEYKSVKKGRKSPVKKTLFDPNIQKRAHRSKIVVDQCKVYAVSISADGDKDNLTINSKQKKKRRKHVFRYFSGN